MAALRGAQGAIVINCIIRVARTMTRTGTAVLLASACAAFAQAEPPIDGIYTCTDANGRKLRSDRPIPACIDREQTVLNPSGTVRAKVGPSLSAQQRAEQAERKKEAALEQARLQEDKRRDRAMLTRYPSREVHDKERDEALARMDVVVLEAEKRTIALRDERKIIDRELDFYQGDASKAPPALRRQIDYVAQGLQAQRRFIQAQENERQRINARFDEELARLKQLWQEPPRAGARP